MFKHWVGKTVSEIEFFNHITAEAIAHPDKFKTWKYHFFYLIKEGPGQSTIADYQIHLNANFYWAHKYFPKFLVVVRHEHCIKVLMDGFYQHMGHEIRGTEIKYPNYHENNPDCPPSKMIPWDILDKGFGEMRGQLARTPRKRAV